MQYGGTVLGIVGKKSVILYDPYNLAWFFVRFLLLLTQKTNGLY